MAIEDLKALVERIAATKYMDLNTRTSFQSALEKCVTQLGDSALKYLGPLWQAWPGLAQDAVETIFLKTGSSRCLRLLLHSIRSASPKDTANIHGALWALHEYAKDKTDKQAARCIKAIRKVAKKPIGTYSPATMAGSDDPVKNARFYLEQLEEENGEFLKRVLLPIWLWIFQPFTRPHKGTSE